MISQANISANILMGGKSGTRRWGHVSRLGTAGDCGVH
jgi:hypothetical protein